MSTVCVSHIKAHYNSEDSSVCIIAGVYAIVGAHVRDTVHSACVSHIGNFYRGKGRGRTLWPPL